MLGLGEEWVGVEVHLPRATLVGVLEAEARWERCFLRATLMGTMDAEQGEEQV